MGRLEGVSQTGSLHTPVADSASFQPGHSGTEEKLAAWIVPNTGTILSEKPRTFSHQRGLPQIHEVALIWSWQQAAFSLREGAWPPGHPLTGRLT